MKNISTNLARSASLDEMRAAVESFASARTAQVELASLPQYQSADEVVAQLRPSEPVFCLRPEEVRRAVRSFASFPGRVLYAVKCNPHPVVLDTLYKSGISDFDVASIEEVKLIHRLFGAGAGMFFNNPAKSRPAIAVAAEEHGVRFYTVDHEDEIDKVLDEAANVEDLIIAVRLATKPRDARYALTTKFGANSEDAERLLRRIHAAGVKTGLTFHVGSQCLAPQSFVAALTLCEQTVRRARTPIHVLNVGGGFPAPYPGDDIAPLKHYFAAITYGLRSFNLPRNCLVFCEPGRSLVAIAGSVVVQVLVRKDGALYLNDGIFGCLQELRHPKERRPARIINRPETAVKPVEFRAYGPTCDSDDVLGAPLLLPEAVEEGDWIEIGMMGAYSLAMRTQFNGFRVDNIVSIGE